MTAAEVSKHLNGKRVGHGKYKAKCPAHGDKNPSLSIVDGKKGVMLTCWSQRCDLKDICRAAGLTVESLFYDAGAKIDAKAYEEAKRKRESEEEADKVQKRRVRILVNEVRRWETVASLLHAHLIYERGKPAEASIARLWRKSLATARERHASLCKLWPKASEVQGYHITKSPREITANFVGKEIAKVLGL